MPKLDINIKEVIKNETNKAYPFSDDLKQKNPIKYPIPGHMHSMAFYDNYNFISDFFDYVNGNNIDNEHLVDAFFTFNKKNNNK